MEARLLTVDEQVREIKDEFYTEASAYSRNRSDIERTMALNHVNALLDAYNVISLELMPGVVLGEE